MAARKNLRPVSSNERVEGKLSVSEAADQGSRRQLLVAMRARIATAVEDPNTPARDLAALTKRLVEVVRDIEAIDAKTEQEVSGDSAEDSSFNPAAI